MSAQLVPGALLEHYKGGKYRVLHAALDQNREPVIVYIALKDGQIWVRPAAEFTQRMAYRDGLYRARFVVIG